MIRAANASGDVLRKAGKSTAVLQAVVVLLLALLAWVYWDISTRYASLHDGIRENALWSVYQLDREARRFEMDLDRTLTTTNGRPALIQQLSLRFDILYSRMATLDQARFEQYFTVDKAIRADIAEIQQGVYGAVTLFDAINAGKLPSVPELRGLRAAMTKVTENAEHLLLYTNNALSTARADSRDGVNLLVRESMALIAMLVVCVVFLIYTLRRQLANVRAAGLSLEAMAEKINAAFQAAESGNRAKSQFMATMGHEIRTPLNAILGMVELLELMELPNQVRANVTTIRRSGEALLDIINEILDFSKIEHGKLELEYRVIDLASLIQATAEMMRGRATEGGNRLVVDMPSTLTAPVIRTDPTRLRQVILNLLSNAIKFTTNGTVTLVVREADTTSAPVLRILVQDTGIGIDEAGQTKLFQPFSQVDASITRKYGGTGLGLTICKEIVSVLGGRMGLESTVGKGSTFWLEIPIEIASSAGVPADTPLFDKPQPLSRFKVLVVEDNVVNQQVATQFLAYLGQEVTLAEHGGIAVEKANKEQFDLILMDMQMPIMDGIEATRLIKAGSGPSAMTPIVAMTANASEQDRQRCLDAGMCGFQLKPISIQQLRGLIADLPVPTRPANEVVDFQSWVFEQRAAELSEILGNEQFEELLQSFFDDAAGLLVDLHAALKTNDQAGVDRSLHTLKGSAANMGLESIAARAQAMRITLPTADEVTIFASDIDATRRQLSS